MKIKANGVEMNYQSTKMQNDPSEFLAVMQAIVEPEAFNRIVLGFFEKLEGPA